MTRYLSSRKERTGKSLTGHMMAHFPKFSSWNSAPSQYWSIICLPFPSAWHNERKWRTGVIRTWGMIHTDLSSNPRSAHTKLGQALYRQQKQERELAVAQIMNSLLQNSDLIWRKLGKYQIPYDYTVEVTNRFKGLDVTECLKNYGWKFIKLYSR